ncbi:MAG TPA: hypothetical protein VET24_03370 [Actinomycetota bacterium]|nr:hypothetical protein [Actinomycetota bacterium]
MPVGGRAGAADAADAAAPEALFERAVGAQARLIHWPLQLVGISLMAGSLVVWLRLGTRYAWVVHRRSEPSVA